MKKTVFILSALIAFSFTSCKKDKSFSDQLVGNWKSIEVKSDGTDVSAFTQFKLNMQASKEFDLDLISKNVLTGTSSTESYTGDWEENSDKNDVTLKYVTGEVKTYDVKEITEDALQVEFVDNNQRIMVRFDKQ